MNHNRLARLSISLALAVVIGCEKPETVVDLADDPITETVHPAAYRTTDAQQFLKTVFAGYRAAMSYHDRGRVRLTTTENGKRIERVAPMSMWMQSTDVDLVAYDVRITIENSIMEAWVSDPASDDMDSQVLHIPLPLRRGRPSLDAALTDPILAGRLGSGMAGPPPQLEWLFAKDPMARLFRGDHQFRFLADQRIDDRLCRCVQVLVPEDRTRSEYRFYIDAQDNLVRQVDLPPITLPDGQGKTKQATIRIELSAASFRPPSRRRVRNGFPKSPQKVKRFVPVPLPPPSRSNEVPAELLDQWKAQVRDYQAELQQARL
ncbi:hypothetical protein LF1_50460 [Rubripirellula obstinata]|uniref:Uncharacterized protein n=1 Tax=Rubripirellula obstinata TaxID=406547 RepID=A0A5B1CQH1_9BACT|nr:hypothetical protein [Rubripirellula obstinata]KAA1262481.1 hypothetical protein LF1_50460 [Rubripirellula obstinata]